MPLSNFLSSVADKAQSAINASPLAGHLPTGHGRPTNPEAAGNQQGVATNQSSTTQVGSGRSHAFGALSNQIRAFGQQYTSATPVQRLITVEKSISIDFDSTSRDNKSQSKEFYTWGQTEPEDLKDVTDRLAYLNFVHGSLAASLSDKLNAARTPLKALRDAETAITPRRNIRTGMRQQLTKLEHDNQKGNDRKIAELKEQIHQAELEDEAQEQEIRSLKRKGVRESEQAKWDALREYGEKLVLLCQAANPIINALPVVPPTPEHPYTGAQTTAAARASLQRALDNYKTGHINFQDISPADLHRSDTRSFGVSHASELSRINSEGPSHASTPPATVAPVAVPHEYKPPAQPPSFNPSVAPVVHGSQSPSPHTSSTSPALNIAALNQSPAPIPTSHLQQPLSTPATTTVPSPDSASQANALPAVTPTIAETGVPVPAHEGGPGPKSGSLLAIHSDSSDNNTAPQPLVGAAATGPPPSFETAEEEKKRLAATHGQAIPAAHPPTNAMPGASGVLPTVPTEQPKYESAEDEKRRLEREERERILHGEGASGDKKPDQDDAPPGYKEI